MVPGVVVNTLAAVNVLEETVVFARAAARAPEEALARRDADRLHEPVDSQQPSLSDDPLQLAAAQPPGRQCARTQLLHLSICTKEARAELLKFY